ncbi:MAG: hypothetical protein IPI99_08175 [Saprospiraceae bacterium]|nr:hypothetical protein [Saprospiraceae bacterium]
MSNAVSLLWYTSSSLTTLPHPGTKHPSVSRWSSQALAVLDCESPTPPATTIVL